MLRLLSRLTGKAHPTQVARTGAPTGGACRRPGEVKLGFVRLEERIALDAAAVATVEQAVAGNPPAESPAPDHSSQEPVSAGPPEDAKPSSQDTASQPPFAEQTQEPAAETPVASQAPDAQAETGTLNTAQASAGEASVQDAQETASGADAGEADSTAGADGQDTPPPPAPAAGATAAMDMSAADSTSAASEDDGAETATASAASDTQATNQSSQDNQASQESSGSQESASAVGEETPPETPPAGAGSELVQATGEDEVLIPDGVSPVQTPAGMDPARLASAALLDAHDSTSYQAVDAGAEGLSLAASSLSEAQNAPFAFDVSDAGAVPPNPAGGAPQVEIQFLDARTVAAPDIPVQDASVEDTLTQDILAEPVPELSRSALSLVSADGLDTLSLAAAAPPAATQEEQPLPDAAAQGGQTPVRVLAIASNLSDLEDLEAAAADNVLTVVYDASTATASDIIDQIAQALNGQKADSIAFASHNDNANAISISDSLKVSAQSLEADPTAQEFFREAGELLTATGRLDFLACEVTASDEGSTLVDMIRQYSGHDVAASSDMTGSASLGGDWILETGNVDVLATYFDAGRIAAYEGVMPVNPVVAGLPSVVTMAENTVNASAQLFASSVTIADADSSDFDGGYVHLEWRSGSTANETLSVHCTGTGAGEISVTGNDVYYEGTKIGDIDGTDDGQSGADLKITLNAAATPTAAQALVRALQFQDSSDSHPGGSTTYGFYLVIADGDGGASSTSFDIRVDAENDAPTLSDDGTHSLAEDPATPQYRYVSDLFDSEFVDPDQDTSSLSGVAIVGNAVNSSDEGQWMYSSDYGVTWAVIPETLGDSSALILSRTTKIRFEPEANYNGTPGTLTVRALDDSYAGSFSDSSSADVLQDVSAYGEATAVSSNTAEVIYTVTAEPDDPAVSLTTSTITYAENTVNSQGQLFATGFELTDPDGGNFDGGYIKVLWNAGNAATNSFGVYDYGTGTGEIGVSGSDVTYEGVVIGTIDGTYDGQAGVDFKINLNSNATVEATEALARALVFQDTESDKPTPYSSHTFDIIVDDGTGRTDSQFVTIQVTPENDAPTFTDSAHFTVSEDPSIPEYRSVSSLFDSLFSDADTSASPSLSGIAISWNNATASQGTWRYSTDYGVTWKDLEAVNGNFQSIALSRDAWVSFAPAANYNGNPGALSVHALDDTYAGGFASSSATNSFIDASVSGGSTAISSGTWTLSVEVTGVNDAPSSSDHSIAVQQDTDLVLYPSDFDFLDIDGDALLKVEIKSVAGSGQLLYSGSPISTPQLVYLADLNNGDLVFRPGSGESGNGYATIEYSVYDPSYATSSDYVITLNVSAAATQGQSSSGDSSSSSDSGGATTSTTTTTTTTTPPAPEAPPAAPQQDTTFTGSTVTQDTPGRNTSTVTPPTTQTTGPDSGLFSSIVGDAEPPAPAADTGPQSVLGQTGTGLGGFTADTGLAAVTPTVAPTTPAGATQPGVLGVSGDVAASLQNASLSTRTVEVTTTGAGPRTTSQDAPTTQTGQQAAAQDAASTGQQLAGDGATPGDNGAQADKPVIIKDARTGEEITISDPQNFSESAKALSEGDSKQAPQVQQALPEIIKAISSPELASMNPAAAKARISNIVLTAAFNSSVTSGTVIENMKQYAFQYYSTVSAPQQQSQLSLLQLITPQKNR